MNIAQAVCEEMFLKRLSDVVKLLVDQRLPHLSRGDEELCIEIVVMLRFSGVGFRNLKLFLYLYIYIYIYLSIYPSGINSITFQ